MKAVRFTLLMLGLLLGTYLLVCEPVAPFSSFSSILYFIIGKIVSVILLCYCISYMGAHKITHWCPWQQIARSLEETANEAQNQYYPKEK